jgi:hypothetical protein
MFASLSTRLPTLWALGFAPAFSLSSTLLIPSTPPAAAATCAGGRFYVAGGSTTGRLGRLAEVEGLDPREAGGWKRMPSMLSPRAGEAPRRAPRRGRSVCPLRSIVADLRCHS